MTAPLLATRDALVAALRETISPGAYDAGDIADYLLESGVVRAPATLADDEALRWRVLDWCKAAPVIEPGVEGSGIRHALRGLAAALTEDPS